MKKITAIVLLLVWIVSMLAGCRRMRRGDGSETDHGSDRATAQESDAAPGPEETPPNDTGSETETELPDTEQHSEAADHETVASEPNESSEEPTHASPGESGTEATAHNEPTTEPATEPDTEPTTEPATAAPTTPPVTNCSHAWSEWKTAKAATCTGKGVSTRSCTKCGAEETKDIPATGHAWKETSGTAATCTKDGCTVYKCTACGETRTVSGDKATGHSWTKGTTAEPTCTSKGYTNYTCSKCGEVKQDDWKNALGHNYTTTTTAPTCTQSGSTIYTCSRCGYYYSENGSPALGHDWVYHDEVGHEVVKYTCSCGAVFYSFADWHDHAFASDDDDYEDQHGGYEVHREWIVEEPGYYYCSRCGTRQ